MNFYERVARWNNERYERTFNKDLTISLLEEEFFHEFLVADCLLEKVDALCDISFVAIGALWKLGVDVAEFEKFSFNYLSDSIFEKEINKLFHKLINFSNDKDIAFCILLIFVNCKQKLVNIFNNEKLAEAALFAICDSNDSKSIKKIQSDKKYSSDSKGASYFSPENALKKLLEQI